MSPLLLRRLSDESLGSRLASGEAAAFDELYRRYVHRLAAYGSHLLGDAASGDDVAQAALLKAYGALRDGRLPDRMRPWLFRIAHNAAIDLVTRRRELPSAELPERPGEDAADRGALVSALVALPDRQRRVYVLREIHGLRIDETARELGLRPPQVEQALFAARNRLAELLVFGERLSCVSVRRLAQGPLELDERRALRTHLRSCPACRKEVGGRAASLSWLPLSPLDWLRGLAGLGGAPAAAKVGAAVATATLAAGAAVPVVQHELRPPGHDRPARIVPVASRPAVAPAPPRARDLLAMDTGALVSSHAGRRDGEHRDATAEDRSGRSGGHDESREAETEHGGSSGSSGDGGSGDGDDVATTAHTEAEHDGGGASSGPATVGGEDHSGPGSGTASAPETESTSGSGSSGSGEIDGEGLPATVETTSDSSGPGGGEDLGDVAATDGHGGDSGSSGED